MREIKFRGIRIDNNQWTYGYLVPVTARGETEYYIVSEIRGGSIQGFPVFHESIGQYTGLKDNNGNPVYEGDIIRYRTTDERYKKNPRYCIETIQYNESSARYQAGGIFYEDLWSQKLEVIGNIYDNPELLDQATR